MMRIFDTSAYIGQLMAGTFTREGFLKDAKAAGATELCVQVRFFPERAMYWTRMLRNAAAEQGMELTTIELSSELIACLLYTSMIFCRIFNSLIICIVLS